MKSSNASERAVVPLEEVDGFSNDLVHRQRPVAGVVDVQGLVLRRRSECTKQRLLMRHDRQVEIMATAEHEDRHPDSLCEGRPIIDGGL